MAYSELEQFLGRGEEKVVWLLSMKNIGGLILGGLLGQRLGTVVFGEGVGVLLCTVLGAVLGMALTFQYHGILMLRRLVMRLRFYLRRATAPRTVDAEAIFAVVELHELPIRVFHHDGTPVLVADGEYHR